MLSKTIRTAIIATALVFVQPGNAGEWEDAWAAYQSGDYATAFRIASKLSEQGVAKAQYNLGLMYYDGRGVTQDYNEAAKWYRRAAEQGRADAQFNLGSMYLIGNGVTRDDREAGRWYRLAAEQGHAGAQVNLGAMYDIGTGVPRDDAEAVKWYRKAAEQGYAPAQYNLGLMYRKGEGVPRNDVNAYYWFNLAAAQGDEDGRKGLDFVSEYMTQNQIAEAQRLSAAFRPRTETGQFTEGSTSSSRTHTDSELIRNIQKHLSALGYGVGPVDGLAGRRTVAAIKKYQRDNGITPDGVISESLLALLKISLAMKSAPEAAPEEQQAVVSTGSGFVIDESHVVTNHHVIEDCQAIRVHVAGVSIDATVASFDEDDDVAVVRLSDQAPNRAAFKDSGRVRLGQEVMVVGYPLRGLLSDDLNVATGTVSSLSGPRNDARLLQITAPVQSGNSGGPLLDRSGNVIGVVVSKLNAIKFARVTGEIPQNVNFAIKSPVVKSFLDIHGIAYDTASSTAEESTEDIAEAARGYTVPVECY